MSRVEQNGITFACLNPRAGKPTRFLFYFSFPSVHRFAIVRGENAFFPPCNRCETVLKTVRNFQGYFYPGDVLLFHQPLVRSLNFSKGLDYIFSSFSNLELFHPLWSVHSWRNFCLLVCFTISTFSIHQMFSQSEMKTVPAIRATNKEMFNTGKYIILTSNYFYTRTYMRLHI